MNLKKITLNLKCYCKFSILEILYLTTIFQEWNFSHLKTFVKCVVKRNFNLLYSTPASLLEQKTLIR